MSHMGWVKLHLMPVRGFNGTLLACHTVERPRGKYSPSGHAQDRMYRGHHSSMKMTVVSQDWLVKEMFRVHNMDQ